MAISLFKEEYSTFLAEVVVSTENSVSVKNNILDVNYSNELAQSKNYTPTIGTIPLSHFLFLCFLIVFSVAFTKYSCTLVIWQVKRHNSGVYIGFGGYGLEHNYYAIGATFYSDVW